MIFSKLLKHSILTENFKEVITFADLCWSDEENNVYIKNGFVSVSKTNPNYFWVVKGKRCSRLTFQKHKLKDLPTYDIMKSEREILEAMGYWRIWDAGHMKLKLIIE